MEALPTIPGKSAPRIIADLSIYDPTSKDTPNPFLQPPVSYLTGNFRPPVNNARRCEHIFTAKKDQTYEDEPVDGYPPVPLKKASGICQACRWHVEVSIKLKSDSLTRCPSSDYPLHFFVVSEPPILEQDRRKQETFVFSCAGCEANLEIVYRPPRLEDAYFDLLIDPENLHDRFVKAKKQDPDRQTLQEQPGIKVLEALSSYISESLTPTRSDASVPADNKRFMTSFGNDCDTLLQWLGFTKSQTVVENGVTIEPIMWKLPVAPSRNPFVESSRNILEDVMEELHAKIRKYPQQDQNTLKHPPPYPTDFNKPLSSIISCGNYPRAESRFRKPDVASDEYFLGLGALADFADSLILFCYQQQRTRRPDRSSYFFDCLSAIAQKRDSEDLTMAATMAASEGYVSTDEVLQAYHYLGFRADEAISLSDEQVLGSFNSRLESSPRHQESELREKLIIVARARGSESLVSAAENDFQTSDQALKWLDSTYDGSVTMPDENVIAIAASKGSERPELMELCKRAVGLIGHDRNSEHLKHWAAEGSTADNAREQEISAAYRYFNLSNNTDIDLDVLESYLQGMSDGPGIDAEGLRHYNVIRDLKTQQDAAIGPAAYDQPVGLENMGNTCYLNCLLQFLYSVRPVRDLILDFDQYKLDTADSAFETKQVDAVTVPKRETEESQEFVLELQGLFRDMSSDPRSAVRPTWDLAKLALKKSALPAPARRSTIGGDMTSIKSPIRTHAPPLPEDSVVGSSPTRRDTNASDVTLIDSVERIPVSEGNMDVDESPGKGSQILLESPKQLSAEPIEEDETSPLLSPLATASPPRPPPIPPRPIGPLTKPEAGTSNWKEESSRLEAEQAAQQQDVEEAMSNVLWKLQCSIKNTVSSPGGGSTDIVNQLFYGSYLWKYLDTKTEDNNELFSTINISLLQKPKTISSGLDSCFAVDEVILEGKQTRRYRTITSIPPLFQVYLQRQEFDPSRQDTVIVKHHIQLEEVIYMDRFMTLQDKGLHELRERAWKLDARLRALYESQTRMLATTTGLEAPELLDATWQFVNTHGELIGSDDLSLADDIKAEANARRARASATASRIEELENKREELFAPYRKHAYRLAAVFVHRGQGGSMGGHYWIYIYDFKQSKWRRYEDRGVRDVENPQEEIFSRKDPESQGAPYFVVYVKEEAKDEIVDALYRQRPVEEPADAQGDTEMLETIEGVPIADSEQMQE